jgi:hypothetical protein
LQGESLPPVLPKNFLFNKENKMPKKTVLWLAVMVGLILWVETPIGHSQDTSSSANTQTEPVAEALQKSWGQKPLEAYHLEFDLTESEDGKKVSSRQYSTNLSTNQGNEIKIGSRVPVEAKEGGFQYLDVGTSIFARVGETRGQAELTVRAEINNFAIPEPGQEKLDTHPVLRQFKIGGSTLLPLGRPIVMSSVDDPNSKRQFQLVVTVTNLR